MIYRNGETGVTFRVWAPNATAVGVKGQFNGWATTPMVDEGGGIWSVDINGAMPGQEYKYRINNSFDRRDPRARRVTNSNGNSVIYDPEAFDWQDVPIPMPWRNDLVIYQMHIGTVGGQNPPSNFDQAIARLDHVRDLGISAIKLMPVNEFAGGRSWGYNPSDLFAIESDYGGPAAMKRFMRAAHERGISVFMDVVHNHYGPSDLDMWRFDGWYENNLGGIYFYNDDRAHTPWGSTRPDFGRQEVRDFIRDQIFMWVEEFRIGGFRWDSVYNIINTDQGFNDTGRQMLDTINTELANTYPYVIRGAEDNAFDGLMNFENVWDVGWRWQLHGQIVPGSDSDRNMFVVRDLLANGASHARVVFTEAHDYIASNHGRSRIPSEIFRDEPESIWARKRSLLGAGIVMTTPGIPMIFQGQEMLETQAFHDDTPLRWDRTNTFAGIVQAYSDLIHARRNLRGGTQGLRGTGIDVHHINNEDKVIAYIRWDHGGGTDDVVVVANFSATRWTNANYFIEFPANGTWYSHFNSAAAFYGADFDNIGPDQIRVQNGEAAIDMGMYSLQIFSREAPQGTGLVTSEPAMPSGCEPVEVIFDPANGPLENATTIWIHFGRNGWQDIDDLAMTNQLDGTWAITLDVPEGTFELNVSFFDDAEEEAIWDTNEGRNWVVPISDCAGLPGLATTNPELPQGCVPVTINYRSRDGTLSEATNVVLFIGRNGWLNMQSVPMAHVANDEWTTTYNVPEGTWQLDFVFHDGNPVFDDRIWDNNDWNDWVVIISDCVDTDFTGIRIDDPSADISVSYTQTHFSIGGTVSRLQNELVWENQSTGETGTFPMTSDWQVVNLPITVGANLFRIEGDGLTDNPNAGAADYAGDSTYSAGWSNNSNGGTNWGAGWLLSATPDVAGYFRANGESNQVIEGYAWSLWAHSGGESEAIRPFADHLHEGDVFSVVFENNWIEGGGSTGVALQNRFGQNLVEFLFIGGEDYYMINDAVLARETGVSWTDQGLKVAFEITSPLTYRLLLDGVEVLTGDFAQTSEQLVRQVRIFNFNAGGEVGGWERNVYFSDMAISGDPLPSQSHSASRTINRRFGPHFQATQMDDPAVTRIRFPVTQSSYTYEIEYSTNLIENSWTPLGINQQGTGAPIAFTLTNSVGTIFYRTRTDPTN